MVLLFPKQAQLLLLLVSGTLALKCYEGVQYWQGRQLTMNTVQKTKCSNSQYCAWQAETFNSIDNNATVKLSYMCAQPTPTVSRAPYCQKKGCYADQDVSRLYVNCCCEGDYCNNSSKSILTPFISIATITSYILARSYI